MAGKAIKSDPVPFGKTWPRWPRPASSQQKPKDANLNGTNLNPIVLDDDDHDHGDDQEKEQTPRKRKAQASTLPLHSAPLKKPKFSQSTPFSETSNMGITELENDLLVAKEQAKEKSFYKDKFENALVTIRKQENDLSELDDIRFKLSTKQLEAEALLAEKLQLVEKIQQLERSLNNQKELQDTLMSVQLENTKAIETREALQKALASERQSNQKQRTELVEIRLILQRIQGEASLATENLMKAQEKAAEVQTELASIASMRDALQSANDSLSNELTSVKKALNKQKVASAKSQDDYRQLEKECAELRALRSLFEKTKSELEDKMEGFRRAQVNVSELGLLQKSWEKDKVNLQNQIADLEHAKAALEQENLKLSVYSNTASIESEAVIRKLREDLNANKTAANAVRLTNDMLIQKSEESAKQKSVLQNRINVLEAESKASNTRMENLATALMVAKQDISRLADSESELQAARQKVEEAKVHMEICPITQKPEQFWDHWRQETAKIAEDLRRMMDESSVETGIIQQDASNTA